MSALLAFAFAPFVLPLCAEVVHFRADYRDIPIRRVNPQTYPNRLRKEPVALHRVRMAHHRGLDRRRGAVEADSSRAAQAVLGELFTRCQINLELRVYHRVRLRISFRYRRSRARS